MNRRLGVGGTGRQGAEGDIKILSAEEKPADFHARYDCKGKTYEYIIDTSNNIFTRNYGYQFPKADTLDINKMREAAQHILGTHDFKCFEAAGGTPRETTVRTISAFEINSQSESNQLFNDPIIISVTGDGFLYNMVRIIVGTLIEVGLGKRDPESLVATIESKDRAQAGFTAPPQGLYLKEIYFDE